jgi:hypothetical protein
MNTDDLERLVDQELKRLPTLRAPATLLPRVLAATVERPPARWCARPWLAWPLAWQAASLAVLLAFGAALALVLPIAQQAPWHGAARWGGASADGAAAVLHAMAQAATLVRVLSRVVLEPVAFALLVLAVSLSLSCAGLWAALEKFALGERS